MTENDENKNQNTDRGVEEATKDDSSLSDKLSAIAKNMAGAVPENTMSTEVLEVASDKKNAGVDGEQRVDGASQEQEDDGQGR